MPNKIVASIRFVNGAWFAYCDTRVLGPFKTERAALQAVYDVEYSGENDVKA